MTSMEPITIANPAEIQASEISGQIINSLAEAELGSALELSFMGERPWEMLMQDQVVIEQRVGLIDSILAEVQQDMLMKGQDIGFLVERGYTIPEVDMITEDGNHVDFRGVLGRFVKDGKVILRKMQLGDSLDIFEDQAKYVKNLSRGVLMNSRVQRPIGFEWLDEQQYLELIWGYNNGNVQVLLLIEE